MEAKTKTPQKESFDLTSKYTSHMRVFNVFTAIVSVSATVYGCLPIEYESLDNMLFFLSLVMVVLTISLKYKQSYSYQNSEEIRRTSFLDNSLGSKMMETESYGYYDTDQIKPGIDKFLANISEGCLYSQDNVNTMLNCAEVKLVVFIIIVIAMIGFNFMNSQISIAILNVVSSMGYIDVFVNLKRLYERLNRIQDKCISLWEWRKSYKESDKMDMIFIAQVLKVYIDYETSLAYASVMFDEKTFYNNKKLIEDRWNDYVNRYIEPIKNEEKSKP